MDRKTIEQKEKEIAEQIKLMRTKMTIFYRKLENNKIYSVCEGVYDLGYFCELSKKEAEYIYGYIIVDKNPFLLDHYEWFEIIEENGEMKLKLKEKYKQKFDMSQYF